MIAVAVPHKRGTPPYERPQPRQSSTETNRSSTPSIPARRAAAQQKLPLLPLYHPLGPLAQSLPELDPGLFGLPSSLNIEDADDQRDGDSGRRSASRAQRPGQKTRERETAEEDTQTNGTVNGVSGKVAQDAPGRNPSPRKRRGGGAKRKRKDTDDGDNAFPPPAKRTRNPRGVNNAPAAPSPLVSEAVVASDLVEDAAEGNGDGDEAEQEAPQAPKRSARTRKPRVRPAKRRDSSGSASTSTSVSVSIAASTKPAAQAKTEDEPAAETRPPDDEVLPPAAEPAEEAPVPLEDTAGDPRRTENGVEDVVASQQVSPPEEPPATDASPVAAPPPKPEEPSSQHAVRVVSSPPPPARPLSPPSAPPPQKEEREEGELSDDGPGN
ncbi:hypothetical protein ONZ51_g4477 [Trametes cubensis]|uniref:Uncharacterized protein n=1 Tax=Trametes cubensis TaxID=1111947 RepID=A0AAD7XA89_9APHY|nr:hypothetical protein ONZ51_g4477 [Trametes cubensis]